MSVTAPAITVRSLGFQYEGRPVLHDVTFDVRAGEYVGIIGPNGGGKTTLLRLLLGLLEPSGGSIRIHGETPAAARRSGKLGYVPQRATQSDDLFPATVREVVTMGCTARRGLFPWGGKDDAVTVDRALALTDVADLSNRSIGDLSGGQRQRVFIARALAASPSMLLLDEPVTGIDPGARDQFYALLRRLHVEEHMTILFVSHDVDVMVREAQTVLSLNQTICGHSSPQEFLQHHVHDDLYGHVDCSHSHS